MEPRLARCWLDERVTWRYDLVCYNTGNFCDGRGCRRFSVMVETAYSDMKRELVKQFYDASTTDEWRSKFLQQWPITHVVVGPLEAKVGQFDPRKVDYLTPEYDQDGYQIYRVKSP
jgi:hypothetical protein